MDYESLARHFENNEWTWHIGGEDQIPTPADLMQVVDESKRRLSEEPAGTQIQIGRLIITKTDKHYDVYVLWVDNA